MYTKEELAHARHAIMMIAKENCIEEDQIRAELRQALLRSLKSDDPKARLQWEGFEFSEKEPAVEECVLWLSKKVRMALEADDIGE